MKPPVPDIGIPSEYGFPEKFSSFRATQRLGLNRIYEESLGLHPPFAGRPHPRYRGTQMVVGSGKTGYFVALDQIRRQENPAHRTAILTVTKQLQAQILGDFSSMGLMHLIKGRSNYECEIYNNCETGADSGCPFKRSEDDCAYFAAFQTACSSPVTVANLSYWIAIHRFGQGLGHFDTLVIDEAHSLLGALTDIATFRFPPHAGPQGEFDRQDLSEWIAYAKVRLIDIESQVASASEERSSRLRRERETCEQLLQVTDQTYVVDVDRNGWATLSPIWPADAAEDGLYLGVPEVLLLSGTLLPKTMEMVGAAGRAAKGPSRYESYPPEFDSKRWRIQLVDVGRIQYNMSQNVRSRWASAISRCLSMHPDEKGIIHSVSYDRMRQIRSLLPARLAARLVTHAPGEAEEAFDRYRNSSDPVVLCTPAATTGVDFPEEDSTFTVIPKMPRPDTSALPHLHAARRARDKSYAEFEMLNTFSQSVGRTKRSDAQSSAVYVLDSHARYLLKPENKDVLFSGWLSELLDWGRKGDPTPRKICF